MSSDESGLGQNAHIAIGALAMFGVAILVVTFNATRGPGVENTGSLDSDYEAFPAYPGYVPGGCWDAGFYKDVDKLLPSELQEMEKNLDEMADFLPDDVEGECLGEGETVMIVQGLPDVSGVYQSRLGNLAIQGWSLDEGATSQPIGRCFVDDDNVFMTKAIHSGMLEEGAEGKAGSAVLTTIDVAVTGSGEPLASVVREIGAAGGAAAFFIPTHVYNPGNRPGNFEVAFEVWDKNNWTGMAKIKSTSMTETYNNRDYSPWTGAEWLGSPNYAFTVTLFCR